MHEEPGGRNLDRHPGPGTGADVPGTDDRRAVHGDE